MGLIFILWELGGGHGVADFQQLSPLSGDLPLH